MAAFAIYAETYSAERCWRACGKEGMVLVGVRHVESLDGEAGATVPALAVHTAWRRYAQPLLRIMLALLVTAGVGECISFVIQAFTYPRVGYDFAIYYAAALTLRDNPHANLYSLNVLQSAAALHHAARPEALYLYPPVLAIVLIPVTLLPYAAALNVWLTFCLICWLAGAVLLAAWLRGLVARRNANSPPPSAANRPFITPLRRFFKVTDADLFAVAVGLFLSLAYGPLMQGFQLGQVTMPIFVIATAVPYLLARGHHRTLGVLLGLATLLKLFPAVLILYFALRGRWRIVTSALATMTAAVIALLPLLGLDGLLAAGRMLANGGANTQQFHNQSLFRVPLWIAAAFGGAPSRVADILGYLLLVLVLIAFVGGMLLARRRSVSHDTAYGHAKPGETIGYVWALATMVLASPIVWEHYDAWLLPVVVVCLGYGMAMLGSPEQARELRRVSVLSVAAAITAFALTLNALPFAYDGVTTFSPGPYLAGHPIRPFFMLFRPAAALLLWLASGAIFLGGVQLLLPATGSAIAEDSTADADTGTRSERVATPAMVGVCLGLVAAVVGIEIVAGLVTAAAHP